MSFQTVVVVAVLLHVVSSEWYNFLSNFITTFFTKVFFSKCAYLRNKMEKNCENTCFSTFEASLDSFCGRNKKLPIFSDSASTN